MIQMKTLTDEEAMNWCKQWPLQLEFDHDGLLCAPSNGRTYVVDISKIAWRELLPTARSLAFLGCHVTEAFYGGLVWIRRTRIAVPEMEDVVLRALERFRMGFGENRSLETAPAHFFRHDESNEFSAVLLLVLLAEWDAYVVQPSGEWLAFISHDDHITVTARTSEKAEDLKGSLETWGPTTAELAPPRGF
jgi:hypothetical protein